MIIGCSIITWKSYDFVDKTTKGGICSPQRDDSGETVRPGVKLLISSEGSMECWLWVVDEQYQVSNFWNAAFDQPALANLELMENLLPSTSPEMLQHCLEHAPACNSNDLFINRWCWRSRECLTNEEISRRESWDVSGVTAEWWQRTRVQAEFNPAS